MTFREFFRLVFGMLRAGILLLFEAFAGGFPRPCAVIGMLRPRILLLFEAFGGSFKAVFQGHVS